MKKDKLPDKRSMEKSFADMQKVMNSQKFDTLEQVQEFMNSMVGKKVPEFDGPKTPAEQAQDLVYDAYEKPNKKDRILLAYKALYIYPDCADAYNLLAEDEAKTAAETLTLYQKGEAAGRRALGEEFIKESNGELWMHIEARPYLRAMHGAAGLLWAEGRDDEAIQKCREILELNNGDNQGVRYLLVSYLCETGKYADADALMNTGLYADDYGIEWYYNRPLVEFMLRGDSEKARTLVYEAVKRNLNVIPFMAGAVKIPKTVPDSYATKSMEEAEIYVHYNISAWLASKEAYRWFMETVDSMMKKHGPELESEYQLKQKPEKTKQKPGRNDACPCGSGKKYKKCCGKEG